MYGKVYTQRECVRIIENNGFVYDRSRGGVDIYKREGKSIALSCCYVDAKLFRRLVKENNLVVV